MALFGELTILKLGLMAVGELQEVGGPESSVAEVETTPLGASHKRFRPSKVVESGTVSFKVFYDPTNPTHETIRNYGIAASEIVAWELLYSDGSADLFNGFVTSASVSGTEQESEVMLEIEVRINGSIDFQAL